MMNHNVMTVYVKGKDLPTNSTFRWVVLGLTPPVAKLCLIRSLTNVLVIFFKGITKFKQISTYIGDLFNVVCI